MTRVLVIGATGFIGFALSTALRRNGHTVYGLARSQSKATLLSQSEIIPIIGDTSDPSTWLHIIDSDQYNIDVVIDASATGPTMVENILRPLINTKRCQKHVEGNNSHTNKGGPVGGGVIGAKLGFVYISGTWVHGSSSERVGAVDAVGKGAKIQPPQLTTWRVDMEKAIMESREHLDVVILRPAVLFGGSGSLVGMWWGPIVGAAAKKHSNSNAVAEVHGKPDLWLSFVHKDDLAQAAVSSVEKIEQLSTLSLPIFDVVSCTEKLGSIIDTAVKHSGFKGEIKYREPKDSFEEATLTEAVVDVQRTKILLGWEPKQWSVVHYGDVYFNAFKANMGS